MENEEKINVINNISQITNHENNNLEKNNIQF